LGFVLARRRSGWWPDGGRPAVSGQRAVVKGVAYVGADPTPAP
jgi:hypothetical protein